MLRNAFMHFLSRACSAMLSLGTDTAADIGPPQPQPLPLCLYSHFLQFPFLALAKMQFLLRAMGMNYFAERESGIAMSLRGQIRLFAARRKIASA